MKTQKILIIDDSINISKSLSRFLSFHDFDVIALEPRDEFIREAVEFKPHFLIIDYNLGLYKAPEVIEKIKKLSSRAFKTIIISGEEIKISDDFDYFIKKPFSMTEIKDLLEK